MKPRYESDIGRTALMLTAVQNKVETANALIQAGTDIEARDERGRTALVIEAIQGFSAFVEAKKAAKALQFSIVSLAVMLLLLLFSLPNTSSLSTFGYPESVEEIQSPKLLLELLQDYNKALVQTVNVLHWFLFIFVVWFLTTLFVFVCASSAQSDNNGNSAEREIKR